MMTRTDHLLAVVAEECAEVAQRATKAMRFGLEETQRGKDQTNAVRIMAEFADLLGVIEMLQSEGHLPQVNRALVDNKKDAVEHFLEYSKRLGLVADPGEGRYRAALEEIVSGVYATGGNPRDEYRRCQAPAVEPATQDGFTFHWCAAHTKRPDPKGTSR